MASIILGAVGSAVGSSTFLGGTVTAAIGKAIGSQIDQALFGSSINREGRRLEELSVQSSAYGEPIPSLYGAVRMSGNIIWSRPLKEVATTTQQGGKGGGSVSTTKFSYFATLAIAICEGEIDSVERIWADAGQLDLSRGTYRVYKGSEDQLPDSVIESFEGIGKTPAYRGLAYVVVEDFPLAAFGNRIPNFTFEVKRKLLANDFNNAPLEHAIKSMIMIPGSGEFVYDDTIQSKLSGSYLGTDFIQSGFAEAVNYHNNSGKANSLLALDQLLETCPNLEWIGLVVTWFGDNMDAGLCTIKPAVEYKTGTTTPDEWAVAGYDRASAPLMTIIDEVPRYGGTPSDASLLRYIAEIKARGIKVMIFPMFFMDVENKPWRGRVTGSAADVASFFTKADGYNNFVTHYANLTKNQVDAFVIGSELIGLTSVSSAAGNYPAVTALTNLAASVKTIMGATTKLTYAADWSEYHHTDGGWYNLDPLWASPNIDFIGIDAYFPLTDSDPDAIDLQDAVDGWESGEHYDFIYTDAARTTTTPIAPAYALKNIDWWWKNNHVNPDNSTTAWVPQSKPIWFTEYGFPSVDGATNQPNVFYDPSSSESFFPRFSKARIDHNAQRLGLLATEMQWGDSTMIPRRFLWTWDARPFPFWPDDRNAWADGNLWKTGHWVNGKLSVSGLAAIVHDLCLRAGLQTQDIDVSRLSGNVSGFLLHRQMTVREAIESLISAYFFDCVESDGQLKFIPRGQESSAEIAETSLLPSDNASSRSLIELTRLQEIELPQQVSVLYLNYNKLYQSGHQIAQLSHKQSQEKITLNLPIVMDQSQAQQVAEISLNTAWTGRSQLSFELPPAYLACEPSDVILVNSVSSNHTLRITETQLGQGYRLRIKGLLEDVTTYDAYSELGLDESESSQVATNPPLLADTKLYLLDIPLLPEDNPAQAQLRVAMAGTAASWQGAVLYRSTDNGQNYRNILQTSDRAVLGSIMQIPVSNVNSAFLDSRSAIIVNLLGDSTLSSATELSLLNGANSALVGDEVIQFTNATLLAEGQYRLTGLLRARLGTEWAMKSHKLGERFVLLTTALQKDSEAAAIIGLNRTYKAATIGQTLGQVQAQDFTFSAIGLKPYAPVHVKAERDSSGNLTINWKRRSRTEVNWRDNIETPLNEASEAYEVDILDGSEIVRTLNTTSPTAIYSAAQQLEDFASTEASINCAIYQISNIIGRGYAKIISV